MGENLELQRKIMQVQNSRGKLSAKGKAYLEFLETFDEGEIPEDAMNLFNITWKNRRKRSRR